MNLIKKILFCMSVVTLSTNNVSAQSDEHQFEVTKNLEIFNTLFRDLDILYVDTLNVQKTIEVGIDAMLRHLDPYTEFYAEEDMGDLKMLTTGKYGGIGSVIRMRKDSTVIILEPYEGMPAAEVGLKPGDVLLKIDKKALKGMNTSEVSDLLRGEPGTTFVLKVQRPSEKKTRDFKIVRRNIKVPAVPYYGIHGNVGYISLTQFTENCSKDVRKAVISLKEKGANSIVVDLRSNGGGLLSEAVEIVSLFVPKGTTIVETRGKITNTYSKYDTKSEPLDLDIPLAVLVNDETASAAEIVSGSLQDLDRAVIIGTKTFGKGLVQSPRELPFNTSFKLTTSKYYINSGRCIQAIDYKHRREDGNDGVVADSLTNIFHTKNGREVRDGGGIMPDIVMKHDTLPNILFYLSQDDVLIDYGTRYCQKHESIPSVRDFIITDADYEDFKKMVVESGFKYDRISVRQLESLKKTAIFEGYYEEAKDEFDALEKKFEHNIERDLDLHKSDIKRLLAMDIIKRYYYQAGSAEEALKYDDDFKKAQEILSDLDKIKEILKTE